MSNESAVCGGFGAKTRVERFGCGMEIWLSGTRATGYRCLNCGLVFCKPCLQHHFESESGETKESLQAENRALRAELERKTESEAALRERLDTTRRALSDVDSQACCDVGCVDQETGDNAKRVLREVRDWLRTHPVAAPPPAPGVPPEKEPTT